MYCFTNPYQADHAFSRLVCGFDPALFHRHDPSYALAFAEEHVSRWKKGIPVPHPIDFAFDRIKHSNFLLCAVDDLRRKGTTSPGPNGRRIEDLSRVAAADMCRELSHSISDGTYVPGKPRKVIIPQAGKPGGRAIYIQNIEDRIVAKSTSSILTDIIDPSFEHFSFGSRPGINVAHAMAFAMRNAAATDRHVWVSVDVKNAFEAVPRSRLKTVVKAKKFPPQLLQFVMTLAGGESERGLRQGSPIAPLLFNLYVDACLDKKWEEIAPNVTLIRYVDDILLQCNSVEDARLALDRLQKKLISDGIPLKKVDGTPFRSLKDGDAAVFLGHKIVSLGGELITTLSPKAWDDLQDDLKACHAHPDSNDRANGVICGWLDYLAPCFIRESHEDVAKRVKTAAEQVGFYETPTTAELIDRCRTGAGRWADLMGHSVSPAIPLVAHDSDFDFNNTQGPF